MKNIIFLVITLALCGIATSTIASHKCYETTKDFCDKASSRSNMVEKCNATYSGIVHALQSLQDYVYQHIVHSYKYLQMATVFASYKSNRAGFEKFFRHLSDDTWEDTIDLIKYITKRGHKMDFTNLRHNCTANPMLETINYCTSDLNSLIDLDEVKSLSKALDLHKQLAHGAHIIHGEVTKRRGNVHDPEVLSFIEEEFVHKHADKIRSISGYLNDLVDMVHDTDNHEGSLAIYLFDEYLSKSV